MSVISGPQESFYDRWLQFLNFYLIVNSGGVLTLDNFSDERLDEAFAENPSERFDASRMDATATQLVLEFQAEWENTEAKTSLAQPGENEEIPTNGPVSIPLPKVPNYL